MFPAISQHLEQRELTLSQAQSEIVARQIFPETTIVRPAPLFGFEDRLLHRLASVTNLFTTNHMKERFWPVHVSVDTQFTGYSMVL
jgi:NADH dehydrogenase (ubiquinone) 1 alpha subcomplex subunit 9